MHTEPALLPVAASHLPKVWREHIAKAREKGVPETAVQLIDEAKVPVMIDTGDWQAPVVEHALRILNGLARSATRCRRLRGLARRVSARDRRTEESRIREGLREKILALEKTILSAPDVMRLARFEIRKCDAEAILNAIPELERRDMSGNKCWLRRKSPPPPPPANLQP